MREHAHVTPLLYDFVRGELDAVSRARVETHLSSCQDCANELEGLRSLLEIIPASFANASGERSEEFWTDFAATIGDKVAKPRERVSIPAWWDGIKSALRFRPQVGYATGVGFSLLVIAFCSWLLYTPRNHEAVEQQIARDDLDTTAHEIGQYLRRSKALLVGIDNLKTAANEPLDIQVEQHASRGLLIEARRLRNRHLDPDDEALVNEVERILKVVANAKHQDGQPSVALAREGIRRENLLFKVRMAERQFGSARVVTARNSF